MSERDLFLNALAENQDDVTTRLVYADWLDEQGEHEEADRQRQWPAAREWLLRFCRESSQYEEISYEGLIDFGRRVAKEESPSQRIYLENDHQWHAALQTNGQEFWKNWSVVTGLALPPSLETKGFHRWVCCPHEVYYWFGLPDSTAPGE